jgi:hypothetical protein
MLASVVNPDLTFQVNPRIQGFKFNDQNLKKKIHLKFFSSRFWIKNAIYLSLGF